MPPFIHRLRSVPASAVAGRIANRPARSLARPLPKPLAGLAAAVLLLAAGIPSGVVIAAPAAIPFDHSAWDQILQAHVDARGKVAYRNLAAKDKPKLDAYLAAVAGASTAGWSKQEMQAFYINAYNACIIEGVLSGRTAESVTSRLGLFALDKYTVAGRALSLNALEKEVILPAFKDPRNHFALVCASASCPKLVNRAYTAGTLDDLLEAQGRDFLADRSKNPLGTGPDVGVSSIFQWYESDFTGAAGSVAGFIARYAGPSAPACLKTNSCTFRYLDYDWTLNAQEGQRP